MTFLKKITNRLFSRSKMYFALTDAIKLVSRGRLFAGVASDTAFDKTEFELFIMFIRVRSH